MIIFRGVASDRFAACRSLLAVGGASDRNPWRRRHVALWSARHFACSRLPALRHALHRGLDWRYRNSRTRPTRVLQNICIIVVVVVVLLYHSRCRRNRHSECWSTIVTASRNSRATCKGNYWPYHYRDNFKKSFKNDL